MPVKKTSRAKAPAASATSEAMQMSDFGRKIIWTLVAVLLVYAIFFLGTLIQKNVKEMRYIGIADQHERNITIDASAMVPIRPDIAMTTLGMIAEGETVADAQEKNTAVMNKLISQLRELGIAQEDLKTQNYNVYPKYRYDEDEGQVLEGYRVSQNVQVKIRNIDIANDVLALAGQVGANSVSGLDFTVDDTDVYIAQARKEALAKIQEKAQALSRLLGVKLTAVVGYNEYESDGDFDMVPYRAEAFPSGLGGAAPKVEAGTEEFTLHVSVTFQIQ